MRKVINCTSAAVISVLLLSCAPSIIESEKTRTSDTVLEPKPEDAVVELYLIGNPERPVTEIGRVSARAWLAENAMNALKAKARELGADAITNITYERKFSDDHQKYLYFIDGAAVVWK